MSFKYDIKGNKIHQKDNRRDYAVLSQQFSKHGGSGEVEMSNRGEMNKKADWDDASDDINHSYTKTQDDQPSTTGCVGSSTTQLILRLLIVVCAGIALAAASFAPGVLPKENITCLKDEFFIQTEAINQFFATHDGVRNGFLIFCSLCMDITMVVGFVVFAIHGKTWRLPFALAMFYLLRMMIQKLFLMRYPEGYLWNYPGFPSLVVPYGKTNDFFYSGHAGGALVMMLEYRQLSKELVKHKVFLRGMQIFSTLTIILQLFLMIFLRGHY